MLKRVSQGKIKPAFACIGFLLVQFMAILQAKGEVGGQIAQAQPDGSKKGVITLIDQSVSHAADIIKGSQFQVESHIETQLNTSRLVEVLTLLLYY